MLLGLNSHVLVGEMSSKSHACAAALTRAAAHCGVGSGGDAPSAGAVALLLVPWLTLVPRGRAVARFNPRQSCDQQSGSTMLGAPMRQLLKPLQRLLCCGAARCIQAHACLHQVYQLLRAGGGRRGG